MNIAFMPKIAGWLAASVLSLSLAACGDGGNEAPPAAAPTPAPVAAPPGLPSPPLSTGRIAGFALTGGTELVVSGIDADSGQWWPMRRYTVAEALGTMVADPQGRFVLGQVAGGVRAFPFNAETGELSVASIAVEAPAVDLLRLRISSDGRFAYQVLPDRRVRGFLVDASGRLSELAGSPFGAPVLQGFSEILFHPAGGFLFVSALGVPVARPELPKSLYDPYRPVPVFRIDRASGALTPVARDPLGADETGAIALAGARHAWVQRQDGSWGLHAFDGASGQLQLVAPELRVGSWSTDLRTDAGGATVVLSSYGGTPQLQAYRFDANGPSLAPIGSPLPAFGTPEHYLDRLRLTDVVLRSDAGGLKPTAILRASGAQAVIPRAPTPWRTVTYGLDAANGRVRVLQVVPGDGSLSELPDASVTVPGVPRALAHSVDRGWLAVLSADGAGAGTVSLLRMDMATGRLTPAGSAATSRLPASLAWSEQSRLYVATADGIDVFDVDGSGALQKVAGSPFPAAYGPRTDDAATSAQPLSDRVPTDLAFNGLLFVATGKGSLGEVSSLFESTQRVLGPVHTGPQGCINGPGATGSTLTETGSGTIAVAAASSRLLYTLNRDSATVAGHFALLARSCPTPSFMVPLPGSPVSTGARPVAMTLDPQRRYLFVANAGDGGSVSVFDIGIGGGLTPVPGSPFPLGRVPARLWTDASGAFLYVSDATGSVSVQAIARDGGSLGAPRATSSGTPLHLGTDLVLPLR